MANYRGSDVVLKRATVTLGQIKNIKNVGSPKREFTEISLLGDAWQSFLPVLSADPGMIECTLAYDPASAEIKALLDDFVNGDSGSYSITIGATTESFSAYVAEVGRPCDKGSHMELDMKFRISGSPGLTVA